MLGKRRAKLAGFTEETATKKQRVDFGMNKENKSNMSNDTDTIEDNDVFYFSNIDGLPVEMKSLLGNVQVFIRDGENVGQRMVVVASTQKVMQSQSKQAVICPKKREVVFPLYIGEYTPIYEMMDLPHPPYQKRDFHYRLDKSVVLNHVTCKKNEQLSTSHLLVLDIFEQKQQTKITMSGKVEFIC